MNVYFLGGWTMGPLLGMFIIGLTMPWINAKSTCVAGVSGVVFLFIVGIRAQVAIGNGQLVYEPKPFSTANCNYEWTNNTTSEKIEYYQGGEHISYMLYNFVGVVIVCVVANICSFIFGRQDTKTLNPLLLAPFVRRFVNK
jgi:solute carrier family 5 (sodium-coupled monocarboxylate transporter), member 8/12